VTNEEELQHIEDWQVKQQLLLDEIGRMQSRHADEITTLKVNHMYQVQELRGAIDKLQKQLEELGPKKKENKE
jgi:hypothetical protein